MNPDRDGGPSSADGIAIFMNAMRADIISNAHVCP
jgi:hypothetical protein